MDKIGASISVKCRSRRKGIIRPIEAGRAAPFCKLWAEIIPKSPDLDVGQPGTLADIVLYFALAFGRQVVVNRFFNRFFESLLVLNKVDNISPVRRVQSRPFLL